MLLGPFGLFVDCDGFGGFVVCGCFNSVGGYFCACHGLSWCLRLTFGVWLRCGFLDFLCGRFVIVLADFLVVWCLRVLVAVQCWC